METPAATPASAPRSVRPGEVLIVGRIAGRRRITTQSGQLYLTLVAMPAPDPYSHPSTVEVQSNASLGNKDDDVKLLCQIGGNRRTFKMTDKETGEQLLVATADNKFRVIE